MIYIITLIIAISVISAIWCHFNISVTEHSVIDKKIDDALNGHKILQLSDIHNRSLGRDSKRLIKKIDKVKPNIIVITGDLFDKNPFGISNMLKLLKNLSSKYPCYYILGNHEFYLEKEKFRYIMATLTEYGIIVLNNEYKSLSSNVRIYGIGYNLRIDLENVFKYRYKEEINLEDIQEELGKLDTTCFNILLAHNPFSFDAYAGLGFDLIFAGHVHGGVVRIPGVGGVLSPQRKFFPKYCEDMYTKKNSKMVVSRGLGYGNIKFRIFNSPEIVVVTLKNK